MDMSTAEYLLETWYGEMSTSRLVISEEDSPCVDVHNSGRR